MKAIVRRYPINAQNSSQDEVYLEPTWLDWWDKDGMPLCDGVGSYTYALCTDVPNDVDQGEVTASDFEIVPYEVTTEDEERITRYKAHYIGHRTA